MSPRIATRGDTAAGLPIVNEVPRFSGHLDDPRVFRSTDGTSYIVGWPNQCMVGHSGDRKEWPLRAKDVVVRRGRPLDRSVDERIRRSAWHVAGGRRRPSVSLENIACRARAGKTSLYRRFDGVEALLAWLVTDAVERRRPLPDRGDLRRDLAAAYARFAGLIDDQRSRRAWLAIIDAASNSPKVRDALNAALCARREDVQKAFARAQTRGEIGAAADPMALAELFVRLVVADLAIGSAWTAKTGDGDRVVETVETVLLAACAYGREVSS